MAASLGSKEPLWVPHSLSQEPLKGVSPPGFSNPVVPIIGLVKGDGRTIRGLQKEHFNYL